MDEFSIDATIAKIQVECRQEILLTEEDMEKLQNMYSAIKHILNEWNNDESSSDDEVLAQVIQREQQRIAKNPVDSRSKQRWML